MYRKSPPNSCDLRRDYRLKFDWCGVIVDLTIEESGKLEQRPLQAFHLRIDSKRVPNLVTRKLNFERVAGTSGDEADQHRLRDVGVDPPHSR